MDEPVTSADTAAGTQREAAPASAIVFGGSGLIGSRMTRLLASRGVKDIAVADRRPPRGQGPNVRFFPVNVREPITVPGRWDVAYNFSAVHRTPGRADERYFEKNVAGAINVTDFCRERGIQTVVFSSSVAVYGPDERPLVEESPIGPTSGDGKSKLLAEHIHRTWYSDEPRRQLVVVRPVVVFGEGNGGFRRLRARRSANPGRTGITASEYADELVRSIEWVRNSRAPSVTYNFAYPSTDVHPGYLVDNGYPFGADIRDGIRAQHALVRQTRGTISAGISAV
ncbi:NAD-dependent epimerase/dehydratase family protein [uncultured Amnibacterium sp.]|uniref:NAD-dependent epimerase/dehydratase family protein n=1 Tax=uncultured Amnibacterium sp. TaxID=1631851 RepID=UPI0035CB0765